MSTQHDQETKSTTGQTELKEYPRPVSSFQRYVVHHRGSAGYPGSNGAIPFENGFSSEILLGQGYNTYALGKWHLTPAEHRHDLQGHSRCFRTDAPRRRRRAECGRQARDEAAVDPESKCS
jgi:arylsulfatase A-like enzyme